MQLSFNPEKTRQHSNTVRNPFLKLGVALLASLTIISQPIAAETTLANPTPKSQIVGKYHCKPPKVVNGILPHQPGVTLVPVAADMILSEKYGSLFMSLEGGPKIPIERTTDGFTSKIKIGQDTVSSIGRFLSNGTLKVDITRSSFYSSATITNECKSIEKPKPAQKKAVFIRPAKGDFFSDFWTDANNAATVGCDSEYCSLDSASQDLLASGVTDVFIAFKTDGSAWTTEVFNTDGTVKIPGGHVGDLAYPSRLYPNNLDPSLQYVLASNSKFDPIGNLIASLQNVYAAANKTIHIHAWFPVFADWYAAQIEPQKGVYAQPSPIMAIFPLLLPTMITTCYSDTGAEPTNAKVVAYEFDVIGEILTKYPALYGLNLDYIRYYSSDPSNPAPCFTSDGKKATPYLYSWNVNPQAIENFVQQVNAQFPNLVISADVFVNGDARKQLGQAGVPNLVKISMPMAYTDGITIDSDSNEVKTWISNFQNTYNGVTIIPIIRGFPLGKAELIGDVNAEIQAIKSLGAPGYAIFNYESILTSTGNRQLSILKNKIGF